MTYTLANTAISGKLHQYILTSEISELRPLRMIESSQATLLRFVV